MSISFTYGDHEYILVTTPMTWIEAKNYATELGGHLAIIDSAEENKAIFSAVTSAISSAPYAPDGGGASYVWLGASDIGNEAHWTWVDDTPLIYVNWGSGPLGTEPDDFGGNQNAMGLGLQPWPYPTGGIGQPGQWNDISENNRLFSLVEIDHLPSSSTNPAPPATNTPPATDTSPGNTPPASPAPPEASAPSESPVPPEAPATDWGGVLVFSPFRFSFPESITNLVQIRAMPDSAHWGLGTFLSPVPFKNAFHGVPEISDVHSWNVLSLSASWFATSLMANDAQTKPTVENTQPDLSSVEMTGIPTFEGSMAWG